MKPRQRILLNDTFNAEEALSERTINLIVVFHEGKGIEIDVAVKVDVRPEGQRLALNQCLVNKPSNRYSLYSPVPPIFLHKFLLEEELS